MGGCDVDDVNVGIGGEIFVARVGAGEAAGLGEAVGGLLRAGADRESLGFGQGGEGLGEPAGDAPGAEYPPADPADARRRVQPELSLSAAGRVRPSLDPPPGLALHGAMLHTRLRRVKREAPTAQPGRRGGSTGSGYFAEDQDLFLCVPVEGLGVVNEVPQHLGVIGCRHDECLFGAVV